MRLDEVRVKPTGDTRAVEAASSEEAMDCRDWRSDIALSSRLSLTSGDANFLLRAVMSIMPGDK